MFRLISVSRLLLTAFTANLFILLSVSAQHRVSIDVQEWPVADVVLFNGDTVRGALTYHHQQEIINVQQPDGTFRSFSPVNVDHFIVSSSDDGQTEKQVFVTYNWDQNRPYTDFKKPTFFQQLNHGALTLIMRESYIRRDVNNLSTLSRRFNYYEPYQSALGSRYVEQVVPLFYLLLPNGEIKTLRNLNRELPRHFGKKEKEVKEFIKKNKYSYDNPDDLMAIIEYYNSLQKLSLDHQQANN